MNHIDILKRAFQISWRYRALWIFGFLLALCGGGGGGGGGGNFNFSGSGSDFEDFSGDLPSIPNIDPNVIIAIVVGVFCLIILLSILSVVVQVVTRAALIAMVRQISQTQAVTVAEGWRLGWSVRAWRLFLVGLVIGLPWTIFAIFLLLLAFSPLLLLLAENTALTIIAIIITVVAFLGVLLLLIVLGAGVTLLLDLARRRVVLDNAGVIASVGDTFGLIKRRLKDVIIIWLLMFGVGFAWTFVALIVVLPVSLIAAAIAGGIPALLVYFISESVIGAAIAGGPLALLVIILVSSVAGGFYLIFRSTVWTLTYLEIQEQGDAPAAAETSAPAAGQPTEL